MNRPVISGASPAFSASNRSRTPCAWIKLKTWQGCFSQVDTTIQVQVSAHRGVAAVGGGQGGPGAAHAAAVEAETDTEAVAEITTAFKVAKTEAISQPQPLLLLGQLQLASGSRDSDCSD